MKFRPSLLPLAALLVTCCGLTLQAQDAAEQRQTDNRTREERIKDWLDRQDKDGDGKISRAEAIGLMKSNFTRNDTNKDGILDQDELGRLADRLARSSLNPNRRSGRQTMTTEQLLKQAPASVTIEPDIAYRRPESKAWRLDLVMPKDRGDSPRPGLVFVHGGAWRAGDKRAGTFLQGALNYAQKGYVCITVNYRLVGEAPFPACVEDVKNAVRWFRAHAEKYNVDANRIGGYGNSAGAHLVAMLGLAGSDAGLEGDGPYLEQSSLLQAVCASATPTDFLFRPGGLERQGSKGGFLAGPKETLEQRARKASPITYVRADAPPFLMIHGAADNTVNVAHSDRFVKALREAGAGDVTYMRIDGAGHGVFNQHSDKTHPAMAAFFARTIGAKSGSRPAPPATRAR